MNFADLISETVEVKFTYTNKRGKESSITLWVYEEFLTPSFVSKIKQVEKTEDPTLIADALAEALADWDLTYQKPGEAEIEFKPTLEVLSKCPLSFLEIVVKSIIETLQGDEKKAATSPNSSEA